jgi:hypothetical protein
MLFTMIKDRVALGLFEGGRIRDKREMNTVVFPEPVGSETPMREAPASSAVAQASKQDSW